MSTPKPNQNAMRAESPATSFVHVRVTPREKAGYYRAAKRIGMRLSAWIVETLNERARKA